ncbi:MAG: hypothetical protein AB9835_10285 [Eubacteriales bacterium]
MPLLNYTTKIDVFTTLGEIQSQLVKHGAKKILQEYNDDGDLYALSFSINTPYGKRGIKLPANVDAVQRVLEQQKKRSDREHAERVAWRILKDWIEAQMAILESQMVQFDQIFFPYITNDEGKTLYEAYRNSQLLT